MKNTTMNTGAAPQQGTFDGDSEETRKAFREYDAEYPVTHRSHWQIWRDAIAYAHKTGLTATTPQADAAPSGMHVAALLAARDWLTDSNSPHALRNQIDAAIAAGGAQEPAQSWIDGVAAELWAIADVSGFDDFKLAVGGFLIATALPRVAATVALTDEQIVSIWEGMPDGASGFRKSWGYMQFARALLAASNGEQ